MILISLFPLVDSSNAIGLHNDLDRMSGLRQEPVAAARRRHGRPEAGLHQLAAPRHDPGVRAGHLPERRRLRSAVFGAVAAFLGDDAGRVVKEVEVVEL